MKRTVYDFALERLEDGFIVTEGGARSALTSSEEVGSHIGHYIHDAFWNAIILPTVDRVRVVVTIEPAEAPDEKEMM